MKHNNLLQEYNTMLYKWYVMVSNNQLLYYKVNVDLIATYVKWSKHSWQLTFVWT